MKKKFCIYTVIAGGYDSIKQPEVTDERFDYILFSDTPVENPGVWELRPIPFQADNKWQNSRYPKINPHIVLREYDAWLYIDGTIVITSSEVYNRCVELYDQGVEWGGMVHQCRDCIYDEINAILGQQWVHDYEVLDWYHFLRTEHFPEHWGMYENNIIFRANTPSVKTVDEAWWEYVSQYLVRRDQFVLMYAIWKNLSIRRADLLPAGQTAWNNDGYFKYTDHIHPEKTKMLPFSLWEKLRFRYVRTFYGSDSYWMIYFTKWFDKLLTSRAPHLMMHLWTAGVAIKYDFRLLAHRFWLRLTFRR